jgi:GTPase
MELSVKTLMSMEPLLNVSITLLRERKVDLVKNKIIKKQNDIQTVLKDSNENIINFTLDTNIKYIKEFIIRKNFASEDFMEVRVAVVGNVDAGKSTMLGVLTHCVNDDGRGDARTKLFRHKHEIESGRTSSVGNDILGFDSKGKIVNETDGHVAKSLDWEKICSKSSKVLMRLKIYRNYIFF